MTDCRPQAPYADLEAMAADFARAPSIAGIAGGDIAVTAMSSRGDLLMAFGDPLLDSVTLEQAQPVPTTIRNAVVAFADDRVCLVLGPHGAAFVPHRLDGVGYWPTSLVPIDDGSIAMFLQRVAEVGEGDFINLGPAIAEVQTTDDGLPYVEDVSDLGVDDSSRKRIGWGAASWRAGDGYVYIYGTANPERDLVFGWSLHVARTTPDRLFDIGSWEYWTGSGWSADESSATAVIDAVGGVDQTLSVFARDDSWYAVSKRDGYLGRDVVLWTSPAPTGPFAPSTVLASRPSQPEAGIFAYAALAHPALFPEPETMVISVSRNATDPDAITADPTLYRPEFFRVPLP